MMILLIKSELLDHTPAGTIVGCNNQRKTYIYIYIFEQDEGGLTQINYLTPLWVIFIPSVTFEPLCTLKIHAKYQKKI